MPIDLFSDNTATQNRLSAPKIETPWDRMVTREKQKKTDLAAASQDRVRALMELQSRRKQGEGSVAGEHFGDDGILHSLTNFGTSGYAAISRGVGNIITAPGNVNGIQLESAVSQEASAAKERYKRGEHTPEDLELLNSTPEDSFWLKVLRQPMQEAQQNPEWSERTKTDSAGFPLTSNMERLDLAEKSRDEATVINEVFDRSNLVDQRKRKSLSDDMARDNEEGLERLKKVVEGWDDNKITALGDGIAGAASVLANSAGNLVTNPAATTEYLSETLGELSLGPLMPMSVTGEGAKSYQAGIAKYQRENNGELPDGDTRKRMATFALASVAADYIGNVSLLKGPLKSIKTPKANKPSATTAAGDTASATARLKGALLTSTKAAKSPVTEGATEGFQTYAEGEASLKPANAYEIAEAAGIGAKVGADIAGGSAIIRKAASAKNQTNTSGVEANDTHSRLRDAAIKTGDISPLVDSPTSPDYNPAYAASALAVRSQDKELDEIQRKEAEEKLGNLLADQETRVSKLNAAIDGSARAEEIEQAKSSILEAQTARQEAESESATETVTELTELITAFEDHLIELQDPNGQAKAVKLAKAALKREVSHLGAIKHAQSLTHRQQKTATEHDMESLVSRARDNQSADVQSKAASDIVHTMMAEDAPIPLEKAEALAADSAIPFTEEQRNYLSTSVKARRKEEKLQAAEDVHADVLYGRVGFRGLRDYRNSVMRALRDGDTQTVTQDMSQLKRFGAHFSQKSRKIREALNHAKETGEPSFLVRVPNKPEWSITSSKPTNWNNRGGNDGSWEIHAKSGKLVNQVNQELDAIRSTYRELQAAQRVVDQANQAKPTTSTEVQDAPAQQEAGAAPNREETRATSGQQADVSGLAQEAQDTAEGVKDANSDQAQENSDNPVGRLRMLDGAVPFKGQMESSAHKAANLVRSYFKQSAGKKQDLSRRPLVEVRNFLSEVGNDFSNLEEFLPSAQLSEQQTQLLQHFIRFGKAYSPLLEAQLDNANKDYRYKNYLQYLRNDRDEEGNQKSLLEGELILDENVKTAMLLGAFSYLIENGGPYQVNSADDIKALVGKTSSQALSPDEVNDFSYIGTREKNISNRIGQHALDALGLSVISEAPQGTKEKLIAAMGTQVMGVMMQSGPNGVGSLMHRHVVRDSRLKSDESNEGDFSSKSQELPQVFVRLASHPELTFANNSAEAKGAAVVSRYAEDAKGTGSVLQKLFSVQSGLIEPSLEPVKFTQETTRRTLQGIPSKLRETLEKVAQRPQVAREDMLDVIGRMDGNSLLRITGAHPTDQKYLAIRDKAIRAKNDALLRSLQRASDFFTHLRTQPDGIKTPFYLMPSVWRQQRVGIAQNVMDPQGDKIHRHLIVGESRSRKVNPNDTDSKRNRYFKLSVVQAMGGKTDKQSLEASLEQFDALLEDSTVVSALDALQQANTLEEGTKMSPEAQEAIVAAVAQGGEAMHSLDGLVNLAAYREAFTNGTELTTSITYEVDGMANGPALANVLLGTVNPDLGERFGMYGANRPTDVPEWKDSQNALDFYEHSAQGVDEAIAHALATADPKAKIELKSTLDNIYLFTGRFAEEGKVTGDGRKRMKSALTPLTFGSGISSALDSMGAEFSGLVIDTLEKQINNKDLQGVQQSVAAMNELLPPRARVRSPSSLEEGHSLALTSSVLELLAKRYAREMKPYLKTVLEKDFSGFIDTRQALNTAANGAFYLYETAYKFLREKKIEEKKKLQKLPLGGKNQSAVLQDLTAKDEAEIREQLGELMPLAHTPLSKISDELSSGLLLSKVARKTDYSAAYAQEVKFAGTVPTQDPGARKQGTARLNTHAVRTVPEAPGVAAVIMLTHATDSAIAALTYDVFDALHIHDAEMFALDDTREGAELLNKATFETLRDYSVPTEIANTLERANLAYDKLAAQYDGLGPLKSEAMAKVVDGMHSAEQEAFNALGEGADIFPHLISNTKTVVHRANAGKVEFLKGVETMGQYVLPGGSYTVTQEDKAALITSEEALPVGDTEAKQPSGLATPVPLQGAKATPARWGVLGTPTVASADSLVKLLRSKPERSFQELVPALLAEIRSPDYPVDVRLKKFQEQLVKQLQRTAPKDLKISMVMQATPVDSPEIAAQVQKARAWYRTDTQKIYLKSPEFQHSGITPEALLHEVVHAATTAQIDSAPNSPEVRELSSLLEQAREHVKTHGLTGFNGALENVHELVAWGMTSARFQREVLAKIAMPSDARSRVKRNGLQKFIETLVGILFQGSQKQWKERYENGMGVLVQNASLLFSEPAQESIPAAVVHTMTDSEPSTYTTEQVFSALGTSGNGVPMSADFQKHLRNTLSNVVSVAYGVFSEDRAPAERRAGLSAQDTFLNSVQTGEIPFTSEAQKHFQMSDQEAFVLDSLEVTLKESINGSLPVRKEMHRLYKQVRDELSSADFVDGDWSLAGDDAKQLAKAQYNYLFKTAQNADGTSDYLTRFASLALTHKPLFDRLDNITSTETPSLRELSITEALTELVQRALRTLSRTMAGTRKSHNGQQQLTQLAIRMAQIEAKRKRGIQYKQSSIGTLIDAGTRKLSAGARQKVEKFGRHKFFKGSRSGIVKALGSGLSTAAGGRGSALAENLLQLRDRLSAGKHDVLTSLLTETLGRTDALVGLFKLLNVSNKVEQDRQAVKASISELTQKSFINPLKRKSSKAVTRAFIRTDVSSLLGHFSSEEIESLLGNPKSLQAAISRYQDMLPTDSKWEMVSDAKDLGYHMATGKSAGELLKHNAYLIAHQPGMNRQVTQEQINADWGTLDVLTTLYSLRYLDGNIRNRAIQVLRGENQRTDGLNGITETLAYHQAIKADALKNLFDGNPTAVMKGYVKETFNPHVRVVVADQVAGRDLERAGYVKQEAVKTDSRNPAATQFLYVLKHGGNEPWVSGSLSLSGKRHRGTAVHSGETSVQHDMPLMGNKQKTERILRGTRIHQERRTSGYDPRKSKANPRGENKLVPIYSPDMRVVNFRYLMSDTLKENILERDDRLEVVMGSLSASVFDKAKSEPLNNRIVDALYAEAKTDFLNSPERYIEVGPNSAELEYREAYKVLPEATKLHIRKVWGSNSVMVKKEAVDLTFGYRKLTLGKSVKEWQDYKYKEQLFKEGRISAENLPDEVAVPQAVFSYFMEKMFGDRAWVRVSQAEDGWKEAVSIIKDIVVVKNVTTLLGNVSSNVTLLVAQGVPLKRMVQDHVTALMGLIHFQRDNKALIQLNLQAESGVLASAEVKQRRAELEDSLARNPVKPLIDAGLFQTIVEDVNQVDDPYSYKSKLTEYVESKTQWVPALVKGTAKTVAMSHDTPLYQLLSKGTQFSDFMARYALYQHLTLRKRNPISHDTALLRAQDAFVNYDVPTHKWLQFANDMGILPFTKYYLRIQKVIWQMYKEQPARMLGLGLIESFFPALDSVQDAAIWERIGNNPFSAGALNLPEAVPELATMKAMAWMTP